ARDRRLDNGDQELGRRPSVTRFHRRAADPGEPFIQKSPEPSAPTGSPTTDSIRAKLIPGDSDDFLGAAIAVGYRLHREVDPAPHARRLPPSSPLLRYPTPQAARCRALQACHRCCASDASEGPGAISTNGAPASAQPIAFASSLTARRYFRISSAMACIVAS